MENVQIIAGRAINAAKNAVLRFVDWVEHNPGKAVCLWAASLVLVRVLA